MAYKKKCWPILQKMNPTDNHQKVQIKKLQRNVFQEDKTYSQPLMIPIEKSCLKNKNRILQTTLAASKTCPEDMEDKKSCQLMTEKNQPNTLSQAK